MGLGGWTVGGGDGVGERWIWEGGEAAGLARGERRGFAELVLAVGGAGLSVRCVSSVVERRRGWPLDSIFFKRTGKVMGVRRH